MTDRKRAEKQADTLLRMSRVIENAPYVIQDALNDGREFAPNATLCSSTGSSGSGSSALGKKARTPLSKKQ